MITFAYPANRCVCEKEKSQGKFVEKCHKAEMGSESGLFQIVSMQFEIMAY